MTWKVIYRDKKGNLTYDFFEAPDRSALFKILTEKQISAIKIEFAVSVDIKKNSKSKLAVVSGLLLVVGVAVILTLMLRTEEEKPAEKPKVEFKKQAPVKPIKAKVIKETPQTTNKVEKVVEAKKDRPTKIGEVVNGYVMLPSGRIHRQLGVVTNSIADRARGKYAIFKRSCNNEIACYLTLKPGRMVFGSINHNGRFKKDFIESLKEPIVISPDDTPEQAQLKRDVIEARQFLKDAMDRGEDIEEIMKETRAELQDFMRIRLNYEKLFKEELKNCKTDQDVEDLFKACNKALEEKGIAPLTYGALTKRNLLRQKANENF